MPITINGTTGVSGVAGTASAPALIGTDTNTGIFFPAADTIAFAEGGVEAMRINSSGNVGIGTSSPINNGGYGGLSLNGTTGSIFSLVANGTETGRLGAVSGETFLQSMGSGVLKFIRGAGGTESMRIDSSGNVGIGATAPSYQLTVQGLGQETGALTDAGNKGGSIYLRANAIAAGSGGTVLFGTTFGNQTPFAAIKGLVVDGTTNTIGDLAFSTRNTIVDTSLSERLRISAAGAITQINATSGAGAIVGEQTFRLASNGASIGSGIADFFGATSSISLEASSVYYITFYCFLTKTVTTGTTTYTLTASSAPSVMMLSSTGSTPATGIGVGVGTFAGVVASSANATTATTSASANLTTSVNHIHMWQAIVTTNLATNLRLQTTQSAGTSTPLAGSYYTVKKISSTTGTFV